MSPSVTSAIQTLTPLCFTSRCFRSQLCYRTLSLSWVAMRGGHILAINDSSQRASTERARTLQPSLNSSNRVQISRHKDYDFACSVTPSVSSGPSAHWKMMRGASLAYYTLEVFPSSLAFSTATRRIIVFHGYALGTSLLTFSLNFAFCTTAYSAFRVDVVSKV